MNADDLPMKGRSTKAIAAQRSVYRHAPAWPGPLDRVALIRRHLLAESVDAERLGKLTNMLLELAAIESGVKANDGSDAMAAIDAILEAINTTVVIEFDGVDCLVCSECFDCHGCFL